MPQCLGWTLKDRQCLNEANSDLTCHVPAHRRYETALRDRYVGKQQQWASLRDFHIAIGAFVPPQGGGGGGAAPGPPGPPGPAGPTGPPGPPGPTSPGAAARNVGPAPRFSLREFAESLAILAPLLLGVSGLVNWCVAHKQGFDFLKYAVAADYEKGAIATVVLFLIVYLVWSLFALFLVAMGVCLRHPVASILAGVVRRRWRSYRLARQGRRQRRAMVAALTAQLPTLAGLRAAIAQSRLSTHEQLQLLAEAIVEEKKHAFRCFNQRYRAIRRRMKLGLQILKDGAWFSPAFMLGTPGRALFVLVLFLLAEFVYVKFSRLKFELEQPQLVAAQGLDPDCYKVVQVLEEVTFLRGPFGLGYADGDVCASSTVSGRDAGRVVMKTADIRIFEHNQPRSPDAPRPDKIAEGLADVANALRDKPRKPPEAAQYQEGLIVDRLSVNDMAPKGEFFWREFETGEFSLKNSVARDVLAGRLPTEQKLADLAQKEISADASGGGLRNWRAAKSFGEKGPISAGGPSLTALDLVESLNPQSDDNSKRRKLVQVIGYADARGSPSLNAALSQYRAIAMKIELQNADKYRELNIQHCFVGENWDGAVRTKKNDYREATWLRRVEVRFGPSLINVEGCAADSPEADGAPAVAATSD